MTRLSKKGVMRAIFIVTVAKLLGMVNITIYINNQTYIHIHISNRFISQLIKICIIFFNLYDLRVVR